MTTAATDTRSRWGWRLWLVLAVVAGAAAWSAFAWYRSRSPVPVPAPPSTYVSPFLNTRPGVAYVGSERCRQCHLKESTTYAEHPMGRSVSPATILLPGQKEVRSSFDASGLHYAIERRGDRVWHREALPRGDKDPAVEIGAEVSFAIGSGQQGQSFVVNRDGRFVQSPISWYVAAKRWDLSPGFARRHWHFSRPITEACLFCHCNEAHGKPDTINEFEPKNLHLQAIGCERCHGPGELHVAAQERGAAEGGPDRTIVNPSQLTPQLREAVCEQCHLQGEARVVRAGASLWEYRPGLPLEQFLSVFVTPPHSGGSKSVSHVEQMHQSRCFQASGGQLGCISCHDPHVLPAERQRVSWYRGRCLTCHQESACSLSIEERHQHSQADSCIDCHMPRGDSTNIAHASITDHRIVRRPVRAADHSSEEAPLVHFHFGVGDAGDLTVRRDLGLALMQIVERTSDEAQRRRLARQAGALLKSAIEQHPEDTAAWEVLGQALWRDNRPREALARLEKAIQRTPRFESALQNAALVALELKETKRSIDYWDRVLALNPYVWQYHAYRGQALAQQKQLAAAVDACEAALQLNPFEPLTRMLLIDCLVHLDQRQRARDEVEVLLALRFKPPDQIHKWFDELMNDGLPAKK